MSVADLITSGETNAIEFKSTLRTNLHTGEKDPRMEMAVLKSVAGFLNAKGGTLVVDIQSRFDEHDGVRVMVVECAKSPSPVYVKDGPIEKFFVRYGPSTQELTGGTLQDYMSQ